MFLFIRNLRVTLIAALAIPTSIIGTFIFMKMFGFTLNNMTMLALSLATGIVIDDAIVVLENIFRFVEEKGVTPKEAAAEATAEIGLAVMATTLSLVVIFLPVAFMTGQVGRYFFSFGITSAAAILISMFVSFTLTPALCAWWLKPEDVKADHSTTKSGGCLRHDRCGLRPDARLVAAPPRGDADHRGRRRGVGGVPLPVRRQGTRARTTIRASSASTCVCRAAPAITRTEEFVKPIEKEVLRAAPTRIRPAMHRRQHPGTARQLQHHDDAARGARPRRSRS